MELSATTRIDNQSSLHFSIYGSLLQGTKCLEIYKGNLQSKRQKREPRETKSKDQEVIDLTDSESLTDEFQSMGRGPSVNNKITFYYPNRLEGPGNLMKNTPARTNLRRLRIEISRTEKSSTPCLKDLKLWIKPRNDQDRNFLKSLKCRFDHELSTSASMNFFGGTTNDKIIPIKPAKFPEEKSDNVPSEFLDEITQEIMTIPMILPSGKIVDRSTVDRCTQEQMIYGGLPRDPFSGILYMEKLKPVFDASLKSRIDAYLLENNISSTSRSLGNATQIKAFIQKKNLEENVRKRPLYNIE